jgi:non-ribosomal peptide synthetase component F
LQGSECLHELADTLQQQLEQLAQQQQDSCAAATQQTSTSLQQQSSSQAAGLNGGSSSGKEAPVGCLMLRLDHMRAKASYSRTIKQWAAELNLTGMLYA